ncbi:asparaginase [Chondromyces apiculatus]|uniref:L-asparaginase n=1 Tax=Chondromyces apiculatus DSM 436 TaxID=1192034 RepID=A0A017TCJ0_9BACT|nr:asparaginase [Chondromyces apiculatus]EYF06612.1 L-asparaginase [Chondromyces apiculatus DSM 436]
MRLLLLHTGGTLMMRGSSGSPPSHASLAEPASALPEVRPLEPDVYTQDLLAELPVLRKIAEIEARILFNLDSADMQPRHWVEIGRAVHEGLPVYDGVVIVHGTDTMAYTASALSFLLPGLNRPVVLTGSQRPLTDVRTDARTNLVDACLLATSNIPEVGIAFGSKLLRGCRATKLDAWGMSAFGSPCCAPLAELGVGVNLAPHTLPPRPPQPFDDRIEPRVMAFRTFPGLDPGLVLGALGTGVKGLVVEAFGTGNLPIQENSLLPVLEAARASDVPVVIVSQSPRGSVDLGRYAGGAAAARGGAIGAGDMTAEAALTKLMITLGRAGRGEAVRAAREAFACAWAGEMSDP